MSRQWQPGLFGIHQYGNLLDDRWATVVDNSVERSGNAAQRGKVVLLCRLAGHPFDLKGYVFSALEEAKAAGEQWVEAGIRPGAEHA